MFYDERVVGSWLALTERLDRERWLETWREHEPALRVVDSVASLHDEVELGGRRADAIVGALVRCAAVDGGGDDDALALLLHLLSPIVFKLAEEVSDLSPDAFELVLGEMVCQIRTFPWRRRTRAFQASLRLETRRGVLAELKPFDRYYPEHGERLTYDGDIAALMREHCGEYDPRAVDVDAVDLLEWAVGRGVRAADVALFIALEAERDRVLEEADERVARRHGVCIRTLYYRRARTVAAVRAIVPEYLAAVA